MYGIVKWKYQKIVLLPHYFFPSTNYFTLILNETISNKHTGEGVEYKGEMNR